MDDAISMDARVGAWEVGERIGRGGFGMVYKGINPTTKEACAIKRIPLTGLSADSLACAESEIDLLKNLSHANIVEYRADIVKQFGTFTETLAVVYITQVMRGLEYLHSQGVIHRDIKGANILTTKSGVVKLADFGSSKDMISNDLDVVGTPFWMAPEIVQMSGLTTSCDIWSLGCTLIELLTGKPPYFDLAPMRALYRIPTFRLTATRLLEHSWVKQVTKHNKIHKKKVDISHETSQTPKSRNSATSSSSSSSNIMSSVCVQNLKFFHFFFQKQKTICI
eukprot:GSMAST32.ASY1.ANO1.2520.1 assembled CDS